VNQESSLTKSLTAAQEAHAIKHAAEVKAFEQWQHSRHIVCDCGHDHLTHSGGKLVVLGL
jgi:hypothetical protein